MVKTFKVLFLAAVFLILSSSARAADDNLPSDLKVIEPAAETQDANSGQAQDAKAVPVPSDIYFDPVRYTLGPDDVVQIDVLRHPEFSGIYPINLEGKIQYKYVGDIEITGLTKKQLEERIKDIISSYVINPEINVTILEFRSKVFYVLGEVGAPGKYYMRSDPGKGGGGPGRPADIGRGYAPLPSGYAYR